MIIMYAYCLFCETRRCGTVAEYIKRVYGYDCFYPLIIQRKWIKGIPTEEKHDWLPGYLFVFTDVRIIPRFDISGIIRCLGNKELNGQDLNFAEMVYQNKGLMGSVLLIKEGDHCRVNDPAWTEIDSRVIKMDRGRKRCCIEFSFDGVLRTVWVGYEMLNTELR